MKTLVAFLVLACCTACTHANLRGSTKPSADGKTYLVVADDNGGACPLKLDGKPWLHRKGDAGPVEPGPHTLSSYGADIAFEIPKSTVFTFDYWGP